MNDNLSQIVNTHPPGKRPSRQKWMAAIYPLFLGAGFFGVILFLMGDLIIPARPVESTPVITLKATEVFQQEGKPFTPPSVLLTNSDFLNTPTRFQASGWIEADPYPIKVTALVDGIIEKVHVLEGQSVAQGEIMATLIQDDAKLNLKTAKSQLESARASVQSHASQITMAEAQLKSLRKQIVAAESRLKELQDLSERTKAMGIEVISEEAIVQAQLRVDTQWARIEALRAQELEAIANLQRHTNMHEDILSQEKAAQTNLARHQLALDRTEIRSPVKGVVQRLMAYPGGKKMLMMDNPDSATIAILYQPEHLQARIDVPLEEASGLFVGQAVRIKTNFLPDRVFHGKVTRIVGEADLQRNTLQAKVKILNPDPKLRPEILCRAEFLSIPASSAGTTGNSIQPAYPASPAGVTARPSRIIVYVPRSAIFNQSGQSADVWRLDPSNQRLNKATVVLGEDVRDDFIVTRTGLNPGDRVILNPSPGLKENQRVQTWLPQ